MRGAARIPKWRAWRAGRWKNEPPGRTGDVWIDVSRLDEGERGGAIYAAIGDYAFNTRRTFVGDPAGLSESAIVRRTSHIISLALRHGTTSHIEPSPEQLRGIPEKGIAGFEWRGNDETRFHALLESFIATILAQKNSPACGGKAPTTGPVGPPKKGKGKRAKDQRAARRRLRAKASKPALHINTVLVGSGTLATRNPM